MTHFDISLIYPRDKSGGSILVLNLDSSFKTYPPLPFFKENSLNISIGQSLDPFELSEFLIEIGYSQIFDC